MAKAALQNTNQLFVINFSRKSLGQAGTGHFSPIGAYNEQANKFLVLAEALFKYPAFWVDANALWDSLATVDSVSKKTGASQSSLRTQNNPGAVESDISIAAGWCGFLSG